MRILLIQNYTLPLYTGGTEVMVEMIVKGLKGKGHEVFVLTSKGKCETDTSWVRRELELKRNPHKQEKWWSWKEKIEWVMRNNRNYEITYDTIKEFQPDIFYIHNLELSPPSPIIAGEDCKLPIVFHCHNHHYSELLSSISRRIIPLKHRIEREKMQRHKYIAVSKAIQNGLICSGILEENIKTIYNGIPERYFNGLEKFENKKLQKLIFLSAISSHKGADIALEAISKVPDVKLDFYGRLGNLEFKKRFEEKLRNLDNRVRYCGILTPENIKDKMKDYGILLFPSVWKEPFGLVAVEAMANGLIVIASRIGAIPEIINDGKTGFLVEPGNAGALANKIKEVIGMGEKKLAEIRMNAYLDARKRFGFEDKLEEINRILIETHVKSSKEKQNDK